jgi:hypothetical protein
MGTGRVSNYTWVYSSEFDKKINELKNLSERAATYLLYDPNVKSVYRENIRKAIDYLYNEFHKKGDYSKDYRDERSNIYNALIYLYEGENSTYQRARRKDWSVYELTSKFEDSGFLFYSQKTLQVIGGGVQIVGGVITFRVGTLIKSNHLRGMGVLAISVGASNAAEHAASIVYEVTKGEYGSINGNVLNNMSGKISEYMGYDYRNGELAYKTIDFSVSMFLTFGSLVKLNNPRRILNLPVESRGGTIYPNVIDRMFNAKGNFFLMSALRDDFASKVSQMSRPAFLYNAAMSGYKAKLLLSQFEDQ